MSLEQLLALLVANLETKTIFTPVQRVRGPSKIMLYTHHFYDIAHLGALTAELATLDEDEDYDEKYGVRYLVDTKGRIIFAREGKPGKTHPRTQTNEWNLPCCR